MTFINIVLLFMPPGNSQRRKRKPSYSSLVPACSEALLACMLQPLEEKNNTKAEIVLELNYVHV